MGNKLKYTRQCYHIAYNRRYIAAFGAGVWIYSRENLDFICRFTGMRYIKCGAFLDDDTVVVATTENCFYFLSVAKQKIIWEVKRQPGWAPAGDPIVQIDKAAKTACIVVRGKKSLQQQYMVSLNLGQRTIRSIQIPGSYRVVENSMEVSEDGYRFLSYESPRNGVIACRVTHVDRDMQSYRTVFEECGCYTPLYFSGDQLFFAAHDGTEGYILRRRLDDSSVQKLVYPKEATQRNIWTGEVPPPPAPRICSVAEGRRFLIGYTDHNLYIWDLRKHEMPAAFPGEYICYGTVIDGRVLIGCGDGIYYATVEAGNKGL